MLWIYWFASRELKAASTGTRPSQAKTSSSAAEGEADDDIEFIEEVKIKPPNKKITVGSTCFAVKTEDLWKSGTVLEIYPTATGSEADEVGDVLVLFIFSLYIATVWILYLIATPRGVF